MATLEFLVVLPHGLYTHTDLLGKQYDISIKGCTGLLHIPKLDASSASIGLLLPPDAVPVLLDVPESERLAIGPLELLRWGYKNSEPNTCKIESLFLSFPFDDGDDIMWRQAEGQVVDGILPWLNVLKGAIEIQTETYETYGLWPYGIKFSYWYHKNASFTRSFLRFNFRTSGVINYCSETTFATAIQAASGSRNLASAHNFLRSAHIFFNNSLLREAVINASAAIELVLSTALEKEILRLVNNPSFKKDLLKKYQTLRGHKDLAVHLGIFPNIAGNFQTALLEVRNAVIHDGYYCSQEEAKAALAVSREIVDHFEPDPFA